MLKTTIKLAAAAVLALLAIAPARPALAQAPAPSYNLYTFAHDVVHAGNSSKGVGAVRLMINGDSLCSPTVGGRMMEGIRDCSEPYRWQGWLGISSHTGYTVNPANPDPQWTTTPVLNVLAGMAYNHYDYSTSGFEAATGATFQIGDQHHGSAGWGADTAAGSPATPNSYVLPPSTTTFPPMPYREIVGTGNIANDQILMGWSIDYRHWDRFNSTIQPNTTATKFGNWAVDGDLVRGRIIYWRNTNGPTSLVWRSTRGGTTNNSTVVNASGASAITYADVDFTAASSSTNLNRLYAQLKTDALGTDETGKLIPILATRFWRPNAAGLEISQWTQPGWNLGLFKETLIIDSTSLGQYLAALDWPTHWFIFLGQNQTVPQTNELNLGTLTTFKSDVHAHVARIFSCYDTAAQQRPKICLVSMWGLPSTSLAASSRNVLNYQSMDLAMYQCAQEGGHSFFSFYQAGLTPQETTDATQSGTYTPVLGTSDDIHQARAGSMYLWGSFWRALKAADAAGPATPRYRRAG